MRAYVVADVFTDAPLAGNPVAVFEDARGLDGDLMQRAARELNLSETVFVLGPEEGADARVRIFTPALELPFAGHPILGTAYVLGERLGLDTVRLLTGRGVVPVALRREAGAIVYGEMEQPIPTWEPYERADELLAALGVERSELPVELYDNGPRFAYVTLPDFEAVAALRPDVRALSELGEIGASCFALDPGGAPRVRMRMFAPQMGVVEDPATGSAAGPLALHLARHGRIPFGLELEVTQGVEIGRPSLLRPCAYGSEERVERITVGGSAVVVARGEYLLD